jgi:hypothetical protein
MWVLTGTKGSGVQTSTKEVTISGDMTRNDLLGTWRVKNGTNTIFVGPALGAYRLVAGSSRLFKWFNYRF